MGKHYATDHPELSPGAEDNEYPFTSRILKGPNIQRYIAEAPLIRNKEKTSRILNGRAEWGRTTHRRIAIVTDLIWVLCGPKSFGDGLGDFGG